MVYDNREKVSQRINDDIGFCTTACSFLGLFIDLLATEVVDVEFLGTLLVHPLVVNAEELLRSVVVSLRINTSS